MFHNTHAYLASKLYKSENILLLTGSILPDIAITKIITWDKGLHGEENFESFFKFVGKNYPDFLNLNKGILAHNIVDDLTHRAYLGGTGYAYQNNEELSKLVSKYYGLDEKTAQGIAHNYIESGVDILLLREYKDIQKQIRDAVGQIDKKDLANILSEYFKGDKNKFLEALSQFLDLFTKYDFVKEDNWVLFWGDLEKLLSLRDIGVQHRSSLLHKSVGIVKNTYQEFLQYSLEKGKHGISPKN